MKAASESLRVSNTIFIFHYYIDMAQHSNSQADDAGGDGGGGGAGATAALADMVPDTPAWNEPGTFHNWDGMTTGTTEADLGIRRWQVDLGDWETATDQISEAEGYTTRGLIEKAEV